MKILDLFSGAGGAAVGYHQAGLLPIGVDIASQPNYPFDFVVGDALEVLRNWPAAFDDVVAIHASPPCQAYTTVTRHREGRGRLIPVVRELLRSTGLPYVIENVEGARKDLQDPIRLCGSTFGLDLRRHRYFEANWPCVGVACNHKWQTPRFRSLDISIVRAGRLASVVGVHGNINYAGERDLRRAAMGINWMSNAELAEAIPPPYTHFIGRQLAGYLRVRGAT